MKIWDLSKFTVNAWDFDSLGTAITPLQRGGFQTFATNLNSFIDIIQSTQNKAVMEGRTSVNSTHAASNFMVICRMLIRRVKKGLRSL